LEKARLAAGCPQWWNRFRQRCLQKEPSSHPVIQVSSRSAHYGYAVENELEHAELAYHMVSFYSTMYEALDGQIRCTADCYDKLEETRRYLIDFLRGS
jgi:hypothetical protein